MRARLVLALVCLGLVGATQAAGLAPIPTAAAAPYRLGPGDEVRISVFGLDAANNAYAISDSGTIALPLIGPVKAEGLTIDELTTALGAAFRERQLLRDPSVSVQIQKYRPFYILGEVARPGQYAFVPGMSVLTAVSIAGGYTFRANKKKAQIQRSVQGSTVRGDALPDTPVQPGDTVNIKEAWF